MKIVLAADMNEEAGSCDIPDKETNKQTVTEAASVPHKQPQRKSALWQMARNYLQSK